MKERARLPNLLTAARELRGLIAEVADVDWRHPAWLALVGGTALLEATNGAPRVGAGELYATYLSANGGPRADTFMARERAAAARPDPAVAVALAVVRARAAAAVLDRLAGELPDQPLLRALAWRDGWLTRVALPPGPPRVAFVTPRGAVLADLAAPDGALAAALGAVCAGQPPRPPLVAIDAAARVPVPAAVAVALASEPIATARHLHRRAWSAGGGPWLGVGEAPGLELVTTCHLVVDGFGHGRVASRLFAALAPPPAALVAAAAGGLGTASLPAPAPLPDAEPLGFAAAALPRADVQFPRAAYAFGRTLARAYGRRAARFSPTFQVPLVPGDRADAGRRSRRLLFGLMSVRMVDGGFEDYRAFRARLETTLPREAAAAGLLTRLLAATSNAPLPPSWRRRLLASRREPHPLLPPVEALAGRGSLALIRYPDDEPPPLYAASAPPLFDDVGAVVLTLIPHAGGCAASIAGSGRAATGDGARALLDLFVEELDRA
jgi:hypothetical protein